MKFSSSAAAQDPVEAIVPVFTIGNREQRDGVPLYGVDEPFVRTAIGEPDAEHDRSRVREAFLTVRVLPDPFDLLEQQRVRFRANSFYIPQIPRCRVDTEHRAKYADQALMDSA